MNFKFVFYITIIISLFSCINTKTLAQKANIIGKSQDKHGCITSAGYTWSTIQSKCIRIFEDGIRLDPLSLASNNQAILSSFILFNKNDSSQVELFMPNRNNSIILIHTHSKKENYWQYSILKLFQREKGYILYKKNKAIYSSSSLSQ